MPGATALGQIAEVGIEVAQAGVKSVEKVSHALPAVAEAPKVIGAAEQGMMKALDAADGVKAVNPDVPMQALAKFIPETPALPQTSGLESVMPSHLKPSDSPEINVSSVKPQTDITPRENQPVVPELPSEKSLDTITPGDVATQTEKQLAPREDAIVPVDETLEAEWRELPGENNGDVPPNPGGEGEFITSKIHDLIGKGREKWGQNARRQFIDAFSVLRNEQVIKKANVIHEALAADPKFPFERVLSSILFSLTPEQADAYLATVSEVLLRDEDEETAYKANENNAGITDAEFRVLPDEQRGATPLSAKSAIPSTPRIESLKGTPSLKAVGSGSASSAIEGVLSGVKSVAEKIPIPIKR